MNNFRPLPLAALLTAGLAAPLHAQAIVAAGKPAQLDIRVAGDHSLRVTLKPVDMKEPLPPNPALVDRRYPSPAISVRSLTKPVRRKVGAFDVTVTPQPLTVAIRNADGSLVQEIGFADNGDMTFALDEQPVLGLGEGGPRPQKGRSWREDRVQYDRRGSLDTMEPRWQSDMYGSRNPVAMMLGTRGWGLFVAAPWVQVDMRDGKRGALLPWRPTPTQNVPQNERNQQQALGKGQPPIDEIVPGFADIFVFDARDPRRALKDYATITGPAVMPPRWALGYMQSHRTLEDDAQMLGIVDSFRAKKIPLDAVIYLGTGFAPRGWNTRQPSFDFHRDVFKRDPAAVIKDMHDRNVKVVVHMVPWDRDKLPTLHGSIPARPGETLDPSHIQSYWEQHVPLVKTGIDAFWPDEGDWFNLHERIKRHQLYYEGHLSTEPNERPWSLQRNGYPGIAQWGGWVWSGDTDSAWKTLEAQIAVGLNYSLSIGPYWGSDIGGFYPNRELTGELYARWVQFASFCASFRAHGRVWWTRLPWGWGGSDVGPKEYGNNNAPIPPDDPRNILASELNNPAIEPVAKKYIELRYQLMPYTYTLAREARHLGLPLMRSLWLHYPDDDRARSIGDQYLWGRILMIAPVYTAGASSRDVYLPRGDWYDWWTSARVTGGQSVAKAVDLATMPIYVRAGAIIPVDPIRQYVDEVVTAPTTIRVYGGADGEFVLYDDDGKSQEYVKGRGQWTRFAWDDKARRLTIEPAAPRGATNVAGPPRTLTVQLLPEGGTRDVTYRGQRLIVNF